MTELGSAMVGAKSQKEGGGGITIFFSFAGVESTLAIYG